MRRGISEGAQARLHEILRSFRDRRAAVRFVAQVKKTHERLCEFPDWGQPIAEDRDGPFRQFIVRPYRFFYYVDERRGLVIVESIWHAAQRAERPELPAPLR